MGPDGTVYVADAANRRVQAFTPAGKFLTKWGRFGDGNGQFLEPNDLDVASDGTVLVVDDERDDIQRFDHAGRYMATMGRHGNAPGELSYTGFIDVDAADEVLNADFGNGRIQAWSLDGSPAALDVRFEWLAAGSVHVADRHRRRCPRDGVCGRRPSCAGDQPGSQGHGIVGIRRRFPRRDRDREESCLGCCAIRQPALPLQARTVGSHSAHERPGRTNLPTGRRSWPRSSRRPRPSGGGHDRTLGQVYGYLFPAMWGRCESG